MVVKGGDSRVKVPERVWVSNILLEEIGNGRKENQMVVRDWCCMKMAEEGVIPKIGENEF